MTTLVQLTDDGTLILAREFTIPKEWSATETPGRFACALPKCHCRRYSHRLKSRSIVQIDLHCYCKQTNCSPADCIECASKDEHDKPVDDDRDHWLTTEPSNDKQIPTLVKRVSTYRKAVKNWKKQGKPTRTEEEVDRIYTHLCQACSHFSKSKKVCRVCGCRVTNGTIALLNKIKMATEHCPRRKW